MLDKRQQLFQFAKTLQLKMGNALQCGLQYMAPLHPLRIILPSTKWESDRLKDKESTHTDLYTQSKGQHAESMAAFVECICQRATQIQ